MKKEIKEEMLSTAKIQAEKGKQKNEVNNRKRKNFTPLKSCYNNEGGDIYSLREFFLKHGNYISLMIMSKYIEKLYMASFVDLSRGQREMECVKLFSEVMTEYLKEF